MYLAFTLQVKVYWLSSKSEVILNHWSLQLWGRKQGWWYVQISYFFLSFLWSSPLLFWKVTICKSDFRFSLPFSINLGHHEYVRFKRSTKNCKMRLDSGCPFHPKSCLKPGDFTSCGLPMSSCCLSTSCVCFTRATPILSLCSAELCCPWQLNIGESSI